MNGSSHGSAPDEQPADLTRRALALVAVIAVVATWAWYHLGWPLRFPAALAGLTAAVGGAMKIVDTLVGRKVLESVREHMRAWFGRALTWRIVGGAAVITLVAGAFSSTIEVRPAEDDVGEVRLVTKRPGTPRDLRSTQRFPVLTTPWGRTFGVDADGYVRRAVRVYPLIARRVDLARDHQRMPAILFRPFANGMSLLGDGAIINIWVVEDDGRRTLIATDSSARRSSFLLGPRLPIADGFVERWRRELEALRVPPTAVDAVIALWRDPLLLRSLRGVPPEGRLEAEIVMDGTVVAEADVSLRAERMIDVPMKDVLSNR